MTNYFWVANGTILTVIALVAITAKATGFTLDPIRALLGGMLAGSAITILTLVAFGYLKAHS